VGKVEKLFVMASRSSIARRLKEVVASKRLVRDPLQEDLAAVLQGVYDGHIQHHVATSSNAASLFTPLTWLQRRPPPVKGVYVWGGVGVGKSMVMDILHSIAVEEGKVSTRRCHFHEFMLDIHRRCHTLRLQKSVLSPEGGSAVESGGSFVDVPEKLAQMRGARAKGYPKP
jgi:predicted ATPase